MDMKGWPAQGTKASLIGIVTGIFAYDTWLNMQRSLLQLTLNCKNWQLAKSFETLG